MPYHNNPTEQREKPCCPPFSATALLAANGTIYTSDGRGGFSDQNGAALSEDPYDLASCIVYRGTCGYLIYLIACSSFLATLLSFIPTASSCRGTAVTAANNATDSGTITNAMSFTATTTASLFLAQYTIAVNSRILIGWIGYITQLFKDHSDREKRPNNLLEAIVHLFFLGGALSLAIYAAIPFINQVLELQDPSWQQTFHDEANALGNYSNAEYITQFIGYACENFYSFEQESVLWWLGVICTCITFPLMFFDAAHTLSINTLNHIKGCIFEIRAPFTFGKHLSRTATGILYGVFLWVATNNQNTSASTDSSSLFFRIKIPELIAFAVFFPALHRLNKLFDHRPINSNPLHQCLVNAMEIVDVIGLLGYVYSGIVTSDNDFWKFGYVLMPVVYASFVERILHGPISHILQVTSDFVFDGVLFPCRRLPCLEKRHNSSLVLKRHAGRLLIIALVFGGPAYLMYYISLVPVLSTQESLNNLPQTLVTIASILAVADNFTFGSPSFLNAVSRPARALDRCLLKASCLQGELPEPNPEPEKPSPMPFCLTLFQKNFRKKATPFPVRHWSDTLNATYSTNPTKSQTICESILSWLVTGTFCAFMRGLFYSLAIVLLHRINYDPNEFDWSIELTANFASLVSVCIMTRGMGCFKNYSRQNKQTDNAQGISRPRVTTALIQQENQTLNAGIL